MRLDENRLRSPFVGVAAGMLAVAAVTGVIELLDGTVPVLSLGVLYVFAVLPIAVFWGSAYAVPVAIAGRVRAGRLPAAAAGRSPRLPRRGAEHRRCVVTFS